jgi:multidrug efflux pump subunit AcrA (membrane-fusion protein)
MRAELVRKPEHGGCARKSKKRRSEAPEIATDTPGELLQAGTTPCFTVADLSRVWVMANLFGPELDSVNIGDAAEVLTGTGSERFAGTINNISAVMDPLTRSVAVRVVADNPRDALKQQMYVRVLIREILAARGRNP